MERYSLIVVSGETSPIRRFDVGKDSLRRWMRAGAVFAGIVLIGLVDYVRVRIDHSELNGLRERTVEQQARIDSFDSTVADVNEALLRVREFERKVRTIANLPGSAAAGSDELLEVGSDEGDLSGLAGGGIDVEPVPASPRDRVASAAQNTAGNSGGADQEADRVSLLQGRARLLARVAEQRQLSLQELVAELEDKHLRLASSPAVWPTDGWLTSRFGTRISPFTGKRQFHAGIDIAGARGTEVIATADGKVVFAGKKGPMGKTVIIDHGYGIRTHYGHNEALTVKKGQRVKRGSVVAKLGSSGRSTGPHLHYTVEVRGKAVNPLDYIFD
ncbi:MAG: M23 family metallopeptidase [Myxococcota bacterium]|nr:M23 family metallopeptidase [Myxococcota bacterium]